MSSELGQSIARAARFMMQIRQDVLQMLAALDGLFAERGWQGVLMSKLSSQHPLSHVFRLYAEQEAQSGNRMIGVVAELEPPAQFDEALMFVVAAEFPKDIEPRDVWNSWYRTACHDVIQTIGLTPTAVTIPRNLLTAERFMSSAIDGRAIIIPLAGLTRADQLKSQVVDPALGAVAEFS